MRTLTSEEMATIVEDNPAPEPYLARVHDDVIEVAGQTRRYEARVYTDGGVSLKTCNKRIASWALRVSSLVAEACAKPAPLVLPDVSDLDGVSLSRKGKGILVTMVNGTVTTNALLVRHQDGRCAARWDDDERPDVRFAAGIVAERLNQMEAEDA